MWQKEVTRGWRQFGRLENYTEGGKAVGFSALSLQRVLEDTFEQSGFFGEPWAAWTEQSLVKISNLFCCVHRNPRSMCVAWSGGQSHHTGRGPVTSSGGTSWPARHRLGLRDGEGGYWHSPVCVTRWSWAYLSAVSTCWHNEALSQQETQTSSSYP